MSANPELEVRDLSVSYAYGSGVPRRVLNNVSLTAEHGEIVGMLGASGSGKSTLGQAIMNCLPSNARIDGGEVIHRAGPRGRAIVSQEPAAALNPVRRVGHQIADVVEGRLALPWKACCTQALDRLTDVGFHDAERVFRAYPHELSGGQRQRIVLAQAFAAKPSLLIADEPTSALDSVTQAEILSLLRHLSSEAGVTVVLITHDPLVLYGLANRILVLYQGALVESGPAAAVLDIPAHEYTKSLLNAGPYRLSAPGFGAVGC